MKAHVREAEFEKRLPRYQALIERIKVETGIDPGKVSSVSLTEGERDLCYSISAGHETNGTLIVELLTGGGFPLKHSGYLYSSSGKVEEGSFFERRWPIIYEVKTNWFRIAD